MIDKFIWLIETLRLSNGLSISEIDARWRVCSHNDAGKPFNRRTLLRWREAILQLFDISIYCDHYDGFRYKVRNSDDNHEKYLRWLINMRTTDNILSDYKSISQYIMLEEYYSGSEHLRTILHAIKEKKRLSIVYHNFSKAEPNPPAVVTPLCVRLFNKRWYMLVLLQGHNGVKELIMAMDRIISIEIVAKTYQVPVNFDPETFFSDFYGIYVDNRLPTKRVLVKVPNSQLAYLKTLPLHHSQKIVEYNDEYCLIEYYLKITPDLPWAILDRLRHCQVIEPSELKEELLKIANGIIQTQKQDN